MSLPPGTQIGKYRILAPIGAGGMGEVYRAHDPGIGRDVAIKVLPAGFAEEAGRLRRFEQEARTAGSLNHPGIVSVYEVGSHQGMPYLVMELLEGETLRERINGRPMPPGRALEIAIALAQGLAAAHEKGILHRDLKPENILLTRDGRIKILDFGLAKAHAPAAGALPGSLTTETSGPGAEHTQAGILLGTTGYMSPEQVRGEPLDGRSDLFALGMVLWEMITGRGPFHRPTRLETLNAILREDPPPMPPDLHVPPGLTRILDRCLAKDPAARFHSAHDLAFALENAGTRGAGGDPAAGWRSPFRPVWGLLLLGAVALAALFALGWTGHRHRPSLPEYTYRRLTSRKGDLTQACFASDGMTILYSATWDGRPSDIYQVRLDNLESRPLKLPTPAALWAVSPRGELAIHEAENGELWGRSMLAQVPALGGTPREVLEHAAGASWSPDGSQLAVTRFGNGRFRLEYPIGKVLFETGSVLQYPRVAPSGNQAAVLEHRRDETCIQVFDLRGGQRTLTTGQRFMMGLAWTSEDRLVTSSGPDNLSFDLWEIRLDGGRRRLTRGPRAFFLHDGRPDGRLLIEMFGMRQEATLLHGQANKPEDVSWLESCQVSGLAADGAVLALSAGAIEGGGQPGVWLRRPGIQDPVHISDGQAVGNLSPDGRWVPVLTQGNPPGLSLVPTGPGLARQIPLQGITPGQVLWHPRKPQLLVFGHDSRSGAWGLYTVGTEGGSPTLVETIIALGKCVLRPDGTGLIGMNLDETLFQIPLDGHPPGALPSRLNHRDRLIGCSADGRRLFVANQDHPPYRVDAVDLATGKRTLFRSVPGAGPDGHWGYTDFFMTPDGSSLAYSTPRVTSSDLFLMEPLP